MKVLGEGICSHGSVVLLHRLVSKLSWAPSPHAILTMALQETQISLPELPLINLPQPCYQGFRGLGSS